MLKYVQAEQLLPNILASCPQVLTRVRVLSDLGQLFYKKGGKDTYIPLITLQNSFI